MRKVAQRYHARLGNDVLQVDPISKISIVSEIVQFPGHFRFIAVPFAKLTSW